MREILIRSDEELYSFNRHLDALHLKVNEMLSLQEETEYKLKESIAKKLILNGVSNEVISLSTDLPVSITGQLRIVANS